MALVQQFLDLIKDCTDLVSLCAMEKSLVAHIKAMQDNPALQVDFIPDFVSDKVLSDGLEAEVESIMENNKSTTHVTSQWLSDSGDSYEFGKKTHRALKLRDYPCIVKLMEEVNDHELTSRNMNSCLINRYDNQDVAGRLHADNEKTICQRSSICTVSLGETRSIDFRVNASTPVAKSLSLTPLSMFIMKPGCQQIVKHKLNKGNIPSGVRYSISFRHSINAESEGHVSAEAFSAFHQAFSSPQQSNDNTSASSDCREPTVLIAGDSISKRLNPRKIGKGKIRTDNISVGGYSIHKTQEAIVQYHTDNSSNVCVKKIFISAGTNDICRTFSRGVNHLKAPLTRLLLKCKELFPDATIYFHSVLPLKKENVWTIRNVLNFNEMLRSVCSVQKVFYLNFFKLFLDKNGNRNNEMFWDAVHPRNNCMGIFAKHYIQLIHRDRSGFNPDII